MFDFTPHRLLESMPAAEAEIAQQLLLQQHVRYLEANSPFYRRMFARIGLQVEEIVTAADLALLPFTSKGDLESGHAEFCCVAPEDIADFCLTSGTTGRPVAMLQTGKDLERLGYNEEVSFRGTGITRNDRVLIAAAIDRCFMAGLAYYLGLSRIGATVIRGGSSNVPQLMELIRLSRPTAIIGVPSLLLAVGERFLQEGSDPSRFGVGRIICIGEPVRNQDLTLSRLGMRLAQCWGSTVFGTYASTEMATAFTDCEAGMGGHLRPDLIIVEIIAADGRVLPVGEQGEVVATPLQVTGMPLLRFITGDIATIHDSPCPCGRKTARLGPVAGRKSQMLKFRGTTVYPPAIHAVLQGVKAVRGHYIEVSSDFELSDRIRVVVGTTDTSLTPEYLSEMISAAIRVSPEVVLVTPEEIMARTMQEDKRKPVIFFDYRTS